MSISAAQCRAARALLDWSQDQLAENAGVARATVADFERNQRNPMRQNLAAIQNSLSAAGLAFIGEEDGGVGVRFRKVEIEYSRALRADISGGVGVPIRYRGEPYTIVVPREISEDIERTGYRTIEEQAAAVSRHLPTYLTIAEKMLLNGEPIVDGRIIIGWDNMPVELL